MQAMTFLSSQFSGFFMDDFLKTPQKKLKVKKNYENKKNEGLGLSLDMTQSSSETSSVDLFPGKKGETSNLANSGSRAANSVKQHPDTTVRRSGVLTKTQKRNKRRRLTKKFFEAASVGTPVVDGRKIDESKQLMSKDPTPHSLVHAKKPRSDILSRSVATAALTESSDILPGSFAPAVMTKRSDNLPRSFTPAVLTKILIVREFFPLAKLNTYQYELIQQEILGKIDLIPVGCQLPRIHDSSLVAGTMILLCEEAFTVNWVIATFHDNQEVLGTGEPLKVLGVDELSKSAIVAFQTQDRFTKEPSIFLKRLNRLNPELKSEEWLVLQCIQEPLYTRWIFEVSTEAARAICRADFGAYTGIDKGTFEIIWDSREQKVE